jgi:hypothetical protein
MGASVRAHDGYGSKEMVYLGGAPKENSRLDPYELYVLLDIQLHDT